MYNTQLDAFIKAAELKSFSKAAQETYITPTALIQQINSLESRLNIQLFTRSRRGIELTPAGEIILEAAKQIKSLSAEATRHAKECNNLKKHKIRIGIPVFNPFYHIYKLSRIINSQYELYDIEFVSMELKDNRHSDYISYLQNNTVDLYESLYFPGSFKGKVKFIPIGTSAIGFAIPPGHRLYTTDSFSIPDLQNETIFIPWVSNSEKAFNSAIQVLSSPEYKITQQCFDYYDISTVYLALAKCCPILSAGIQIAQFKNFKFFPLHTVSPISYGIVSNLSTDKPVHDFLEMLLDVLRKNEMGEGIEQEEMQS